VAAPTREQVIAVHEAGHAVAARLLRPYAGLVKFVAHRLERELVLDGEAVDRLVGVSG
jgi:hypothetical protein